METNYRVVPQKRGWLIKGPSSYFKHYDTKKKAVAVGRFLASQKNIPLIIHKKDGKIQSVISVARIPKLKRARVIRRIDPKKIRLAIAKVDYEL